MNFRGRCAVRAVSPAGAAWRPPSFLASYYTMKTQPLRIIQDSREQCPFRFEGFNAVVTVGTLEAGDYSLAGFERRIAIERKTLPDLIACLGVERERFERELQRLKAHDFACIIVESPVVALRQHLYASRLDEVAAWQSCLAFMQRFRLPIIFCQNRRDAEETTFHLLRHFARDRWRELQALRLVPTMPPERTDRHRPGAGMDGKPNPPESRQRAGAVPHHTGTMHGAGL